jgi:hypothetical protein
LPPQPPEPPLRATLRTPPVSPSRPRRRSVSSFCAVNLRRIGRLKPSSAHPDSGRHGSGREWEVRLGAYLGRNTASYVAVMPPGRPIPRTKPTALVRQPCRTSRRRKSVEARTAAMNDHRGIAVETTGGSADRGQLRHPPVLLLPLMRAAGSSAARLQPASFGRLAFGRPSSRWANRRSPTAVGMQGKDLRGARSTA